MKSVKFVLFVLLLAVLSACAAAPTGPAIKIESPWARAANSGDNTGVFMIIKNTSGQADKLLSAAYADAMMTGVHQTVMKDNVMTMSEVPSLDIPANGQVELKSGSYHVMIMELMKELKPGDKIKVTLTFEKAGKVDVEAEVRAP
jgi:periplasmic copper chaperone A